MRAALSEKIRKIHQTYYLPTMTALATAIYENETIQPMAQTNEDYRNHAQYQLAGVEKIAGTYPFTLERA